MEIAIGILVGVVLFFLYLIIEIGKENTRLIQSNDKLKATLVKKDFEIAKLEKYNHELKKIVEFYDK